MRPCFCKAPPVIGGPLEDCGNLKSNEGTPVEHIMQNRVHASVIRGIGALGLALGGAAAPAMAQGNSFTYELRLVNEQLSRDGLILLPRQGGTVSFWLEARSRANSLLSGNFNYGVLRAGNSPSGQSPAVIQVNDPISPATRLARGQVSPAGPGGFALTGRAAGFRNGGPVDDATASPWHSTSENGSGGAAFPSGAGNEFGAFDFSGTRLFGFDAFAGTTRTGATNPWTTQFPAAPVGDFTPWNRMYRVDVQIVDGFTPRNVLVSVGAFLSAGIRTVNSGGTWTMSYAGSGLGGQFVTGSATIPIIPSPSAATVMGLGLAVASRRRR
jgi:uncharacterized protein (TIGR03382 family)